MSNVIRIVLGVVVLIGAFVTKQKTSSVIEDGGGEAGVASVFGREMTSSSLNMILAVFAILGVVLLVLGVVGLVKNGK